VLCGQAGQGIQTVERLLMRIGRLAGYDAFATKEYMSRVRGGLNSTQIRFSDKPVRAFIDRTDILVPLDKGAIEHLGKRISDETLIIGSAEGLGAEAEVASNFVDVPFVQIAEEAGGKVYANTVAVGVLSGVLGIGLDTAGGYLKTFFAGKSTDVIDGNVRALARGHAIGTDLATSGRTDFSISPGSSVERQILINGAEAVGLGAIAGGCNFVSSYPMSPSTGVLVFLAQHGRDFDLIAEQAEDEIAAVNMALGAWYAGARAMVTTSGGGFALMTEGISLAGMIESPLVVHLAQRPGPATGLPTRTEQGDLDLALYAGHGEFPRIILAPGTICEAIELARRAFDLADRFQVPVFVLTDQYFMDSYYNLDAPDLSGTKVEKHVIKTGPDYRRYQITEDGLSSRGIPGFGKGLVCVDSDEHDEGGHITEDMGVRVQMADKRLKRLDLLKDEAFEPMLIGPEAAENIIVCWGSTRHIIEEAVASLGRDDTAVLHFGQVYPLHSRTSSLLKAAKKVVVVEGNATGQFARILKIHADIHLDHKILKYDGLPFAADTLARELRSIL
jgi:2-oxoglutarate ferredoxin oxidoreductase subunit alpha